MLRDAANGRHTSGANNSIAVSAIKRAEDEPRDGHQTADLLEALRRRRGEREAASYEDRPDGQAVESELRIIDVPLTDFESLQDGSRDQAASSAQSSAASAAVGRQSKKGRASMPSWDEIVFGARTDDDLA